MYGLNVKLQVFSSQSASHAIHRWTFVVVYLQDKELNEKCTIHNTYIYIYTCHHDQPHKCCNAAVASFPSSMAKSTLPMLGRWARLLSSSWALTAANLWLFYALSAYRTYNQCLYNAVTWGTTLHLSQKFAKPSISHPAGIFIMMPNKFRIQTTRSRSL